MRLVFRLRSVDSTRSLTLHLLFVKFGFELEIGLQQGFNFSLHGELILSLSFLNKSQLCLLLFKLQLEAVAF